jgi:hypothetical protein
MAKALRVVFIAALIFALPALGRADQTTVGVTLNGTSGTHIETSQSSNVPFVPLPVIDISYRHKRYEAHAEITPPLGPVPLANGSSLHAFYSQDPRLSYIDADLRYWSPDDRYAFGAGETIVNQSTLYAPSPYVAASRVVGFRLFGTGTIYDRGIHRLDVSFATSPAMQGLQNDGEAECASIVDTSLRWSVDMGHYVFVYGMRYINYAAAYTDANELADRNHLLMPFAGLEWPLHQRPESRRMHAAQFVPPKNAVAWRFGASLLAANGARSTFGSFSPTPIPFALLPQLWLERSDARSLISLDAIAPNSSSNLFGSLGQRWGYLRARALLRVTRRIALGVAEEVVNYRALGLRYQAETARSEGLAAAGLANIEQDVHGSLDASIDALPYAHLRTYEYVDLPRLRQPYAIVSYQHGARIDMALTRTAYGRVADVQYGLRYINQTSNYGFNDLTRTFSLVPFAGITAKL